VTYLLQIINTTDALYANVEESMCDARTMAALGQAPIMLLDYLMILQYSYMQTEENQIKDGANSVTTWYSPGTNIRHRKKVNGSTIGPILQHWSISII